MATVAELIADIDALDDRIRALRNAPAEVETQGADGAKIKIRREGDLERLQKERAIACARLSAKRGDTSVEPTRPGVDVDRTTDNGDGW